MSESTEPDKSASPAADAEQLELKLPDESSAPKDLALWAGVLVLLTLIAYWPATTGSFVWRDERVAQNHALLAPDGLSVGWLGRWRFAQNFSFPEYQPAAWTACWIEYRVGGKTDQGVPAPMAYHVASLIFHALAAVLLWLVLRELLLPGAWIIAGIFALHPIHSEAVSWISEQSTVLAGMFFIGSIYCYLLFIQWRQRDLTERAAGREGVDPAQTWGLYSGSCVCFLLAILSEPSAAVLPVVLLLLLWWRKKLTSQDGLLITPMMVVALALWISTADLHTRPREEILLHTPPLFQAITLGRGLRFSIFRLVLPTGFSIMDFPSHQRSVQLGDAINIAIATAMAVAIAGLVTLQFLKKQSGAGLLVALSIMFLLVGGSLNWFDAGRRSPITDCVAYLAMVPVVTLIVYFMSRIKLPGPHPQSAVAMTAVVLLVFGALSWSRTRAFDNSVALWRDVVQKDPASADAQTALAEELRKNANADFAAGNTDTVQPQRTESIEHATLATRIDPTDAQAHRVWANVLVEEGDVQAAIPHFDQAVALAPHSPAIRTEYAAALILIGKFKQAIPQLDAALIDEPLSSDAHRLLGDAYSGLGATTRAMSEQELALSYNPANVIARQKLAEMQAKAGTPADLKESVTNYLYILGDLSQQNRADLWLAVADVVQRQGDLEHAMELLKTAEGLAREDTKLLEKIDAEREKVKQMAATRPSTLPSRQGTTMPAVSLPMQ